MLTSDLVRTVRKGGELRVQRLDGKRRARAQELAIQYLALIQDLAGATREEIEATAAAVPLAPNERRLGDGLFKLVLDRATFDESAPAPPEELRREVFTLAAAARRGLADGAAFDRAALLGQVATARGLEVPALERALYADLRGAQILAAFEPLSAEALVEAYDRSQAQAVLLKAVKVRVELRTLSIGAARALFHRMKFLRLLATIEPLPAGGDRLEIDGPYSLFESVTKYGLQLALLLPALEAAGAYVLEAEVRWGKAGERLVFKHEGGAEAGGAIGADLPDEVVELLERFSALKSEWTVEPAQAILQLPGIGLCVPDLCFRHPEVPEGVLLEVMGYWSRAAVWRRVELVQKGLTARILFAVSTRLRVSEEALSEDLPGALYVYKGVLSARAILEKLRRFTASGGS